MNKEYRLMTIDAAVNIIKDAETVMDNMVVRDGFVVNLGMSRIYANDYILQNLIGTPFYINDTRVLRIMSGSARVEINMTEYSMAEGDVLILSAGSYLETVELSETAAGQIVAFESDKLDIDLQLAGKTQLLIHPSEDDWNEIGRLFEFIYIMARHEPFREKAVHALLQALVANIVFLSESKPPHRPATRAEFIFQRFMAELNANRRAKKTVSEYAERLCVTPQYLSKMVSQASGKTVSQWISKAVILEAKLLLKDNSRTVSEVSDMLNFPNDSFFCRFFKRETGLTPSGYRNR